MDLRLHNLPDAEVKANAITPSKDWVAVNYVDHPEKEFWVPVEEIQNKNQVFLTLLNLPTKERK